MRLSRRQDRTCPPVDCTLRDAIRDVRGVLTERTASCCVVGQRLSSHLRGADGRSSHHMSCCMPHFFAPRTKQGSRTRSTPSSSLSGAAAMTFASSRSRTTSLLPSTRSAQPVEEMGQKARPLHWALVRAAEDWPWRDGVLKVRRRAPARDTCHVS